MAQVYLVSLRAMADAFIAGDIEQVADRFVYPMPLWINAGQSLIRDRRDMIRALSALRTRYISAGVTHIEPEIAAVPFPGRSFAPLWVAWHHRDASGARVASSFVRYIISTVNPGEGVKIELAEYSGVAFQDALGDIRLAAGF